MIGRTRFYVFWIVDQIYSVRFLAAMKANIEIRTLQIQILHEPLQQKLFFYLFRHRRAINLAQFAGLGYNAGFQKTLARGFW
jgi:hypothetical protein